MIKWVPLVLVCSFEKSKIKSSSRFNHHYIFPEEEFIKKYPLFIEELKKYKFHALKHY